MPREESLKQRKKKHFERHNCQVIACFEYWNNHSHQSLGGILKKKQHWNFFNVAPSPKYNGLTSGVSNAIIHNKNIYTLGEVKVLLVEAKNCKFLLIKNNIKQPQNNKQKVERIF